MYLYSHCRSRIPRDVEVPTDGDDKIVARMRLYKCTLAPVFHSDVHRVRWLVMEVLYTNVHRCV